MISPEDFQEPARKILGEVANAIVGQEAVARGILTAMIGNGHVLLEGVPGLGKTSLVRAFSGALDLEFGRVQFTPDLMPADITGTSIVSEDEAGRRAPFLSARPNLRQSYPGRRNQSRHAQNAKRPAGGHAGADGDGRQPHSSPPRAVLRARHPESD